MSENIKVNYLGELLEPLDFNKTFEYRQEHIENLLCRFLNTKTVVAFIGAGMSMPLGYPSWWRFASDMFELLKITLSCGINEKCLAYKLIENTDEQTNVSDSFSKVFSESEIAEAFIQLLKKFISKDLKSAVIKSVSDGFNKKTTDFGRFKKYLSEKKSKEIDFQTIFSECERFLCDEKEWEIHKQSKFFRILVKTYFQIKRLEVTIKKHEKLKDKKQNPYLALTDLPIRKFVTFNYDLEIERTLLFKEKNPEKTIKDVYTDKKITCKEIIDKSGEKSFSQTDKFCSQLADFSISRHKETENAIFHCHGRVDETENCVVSEEDYQKWYLRKDNQKYTPFRQTLDITLDSNPILFLGFSMNDPDFMRILRRISANRPMDKTRNPLFCLLYVCNDEILDRTEVYRDAMETYKVATNVKNISIKNKNIAEEVKECAIKKAREKSKWVSEDEVRDECTMLYIKYGLHVIPVLEKADTQTTQEICQKLIELDTKWQGWWKGIAQKPKFRKFDIDQSGFDEKSTSEMKTPVETNSYYHYEFKIPKAQRIQGFDDVLHKELDKCLGFLEDTHESANEAQDKAGEQASNFRSKPLFLEGISVTLKNILQGLPQHSRKLEDPFAKNIAVVVGDGGTGKSWSIQHYLKSKGKIKVETGKLKYNIFFWSSYYANDVLTGIDRLIEFFTAPFDRLDRKIKELKNSENSNQVEIKKLKKERKEFFEKKENAYLNLISERTGNPKFDKFESLKLILDNNPNAIIVFDGIEKLLKPNKENTEGEAVNPEVRKFFKIITNHKVKSRVIITTRIFPSDIFYNLEEVIRCEDDYHEKSKLLDIKSQIRQDKILSAPRCWSKNLEGKEYLKINKTYLATFGKEQDFYSYFCSLFDGHVFAISIVKGILEDISSESVEYEKRTKSLIDRIISTPVEVSVNRVIKEAISNLEQDNSNFYSDFIERISLFMHPVRKEVINVFFVEIKKESNSFSLSKVLKSLVSKNLVQKVLIKGKIRYVVHPLIRSYVFETLHESRFSSFPGLQLPGVTSSKEVVDPGNKQGQTVSIGLFTDLCDEAKKVAKIANGKKNEIRSDEFYLIASDLCRAAFSILRSRYCTNTVTRWGNYTQYLQQILLLFDTAKRVSKEHWDFNEPTKSGFELCSDQFAPLYSDELAWVYNEIGIASFGMGFILNAAGILGEGYEINRLIDKEFEGRYTFQSNINKGAISLHYGKLASSLNHLDRAYEIANRLGNNSLIGRVIGYRAVVKYLRGSLEEADVEFNQCYEILDDNLRAKSTFLTMHGELLLKLGKFDEAFNKIEQSRHIAESLYYPDLVDYAKLARANYYMIKGDFITAQNEFQQLLQSAREKHLRRIEVGTLSGMSRLAEKLGDYSTAIARAIEALKIANEYSLRLHQTLSMIVLGTALINGHQHRELGISCLKTAKALAKKQEYFLRANEADAELIKLNIV